MKMTPKKITTIVVAVVVALIMFLAFLGSWYTIDEGDRGVLTRYGSVVGVAQPGLGFKVPMLDKVNTITVRDQVELYDNLAAYSRDQQPAAMAISVSYRLRSDQVDDIYRIYTDAQGIVDRLITRKVMEETKSVFGRFSAAEAIRDRGRLNDEIRGAIQGSIDGPVIILGVQVEDLKFSRAYEESVEQRMLAEVAVERENQNLEREKVEADIVRERAMAQADQVRYNAEAEADAIRMRGEAEAQAIEARAEALRNNASLIELVKAERWDGKLPTTMLPDSTVPFIEAK